MPGASVGTASEAPAALRTGPLEARPARLSPGPGKSAAEVADHQRARIGTAMVEAVADSGYSDVTMRQLTRLAGVSSRTFYERYSGKEECFLCTHERLVRRLVCGILEEQARQRDWTQRLRHTVAALMRAPAEDPKGARLLLVEVHTAGPSTAGQQRRAEQTLQERVADCFEQDSSGARMPPVIAKGIVAGLLSIARSRVIEDRADELPDLVDRLTEWALALSDPAAGTVVELDRRRARGTVSLGLPPDGSSGDQHGEAPAAGDRDLFVSAAAKLTAADGYENLTTRGICTAAGSSRRSFGEDFPGVAECFLAAFERKATEVLHAAAAVQRRASDWQAGLHAAIALICDRVAADPVFASVCFDKVLAAGSDGARAQARLAETIVTHLQTSAPALAADPVQLEASVGAIWGILASDVIAGQAWRARRRLTSLAYVARAPLLVGASVPVVRRQSSTVTSPERHSEAVAHQ